MQMDNDPKYIQISQESLQGQRELSHLRVFQILDSHQESHYLNDFNHNCRVLENILAYAKHLDSKKMSKVARQELNDDNSENDEQEDVDVTVQVNLLCNIFKKDHNNFLDVNKNGCIVIRNDILQSQSIEFSSLKIDNLPD